MTVPATPATLPACLGVMCPEHGQCQRYYDVEQVGSENSIGNCFEHSDDRPRFIPIKPATEDA